VTFLRVSFVCVCVCVCVLFALLVRWCVENVFSVSVSRCAFQCVVCVCVCVCVYIWSSDGAFHTSQRSLVLGQCVVLAVLYSHVTAIQIPYVFRYLTTELAAMNIKVSLDIK
jgi:hypothetical protein